LDLHGSVTEPGDSTFREDAPVRVCGSFPAQTKDEMGDRVLEPDLAAADGRRWSPASVAFLLVLGAAAAVILRAGHGLTFIGDEWEWIQDRATPSVTSLFGGFHEHWTTVPLAIHQVLYRIVGVESHFPYRLVVLVTHLVASSLMFRYLRVRVGSWIALAGAGAFALYGFSAQSLTWPACLGWSIVVASVVGALLLLDSEQPRSAWYACGLLTVAVSSLSAGVPFVLGIMVERTLRREQRRLWVPLVPLGLYAIWWMTERGAGAAAPADIVTTIRYGWSIIAQTIGTLSGLGPRGSRVDIATVTVAALIAVAWWVLGRPHSPRLIGNVTALAILVAALAITRAGGVESPGQVPAWYSYTVTASFLLVVAELAGTARLRWPLAAAAGRAVVVIAILGSLWSATWNVRELEHTTDIYRDMSERVHAQLGVLELIDREVGPHFKPLIYRWMLTAQRYREIVAAEGGLGWSMATIRTTADEQAREAADETLVRGLGVRPQRHAATGTVAPGAIVTASSGTVRAAGCLEVTPTASSPMVVNVTADALEIQLSTSGERSKLSIRAFADGGQPIGVIAANRTVAVQAPALPEVGPWTLEIRTRSAIRLCATTTL
jgi:hypothetical protein